MLDMKDRLFLKPKPSDFSALVLHHTVVLLLLTLSCRGHLIGPTQPIVAMLGDDIVLPCYLEPFVDASSMTVEWARSDLEPRFVYLMRDNVELPTEQNSLYKSRTSLSTNKLKCGDISLKLSKVKLSDAGAYKCLIPNLKTEYVAEITVGSVSTPDITMSKDNNGVTLECKSGSWYPQPDMFWMDVEGNILSAGPTERVSSPDGLYAISSRVTVEKRHSNRFTCRVQNNINQTRETYINVPDDFFLVQANSAVPVIICLAVCFMSIAAVVFVMWKWGRNKEDITKKKGSPHGITPFHDIELQLLMEGQRQGDPTVAEKLVNMKKAKHDEALKSNVEELNHVQNVITTLTEQKEDLKKQREKLISQLQEVKIKLEVIKKKLNEKAKLDTEKKENKRKNINEELNKRKKELDELLQNTKKLLETTEDLIINMTERKGKLENEQKQLKPTKTQIEEIQRELKSESEKAEKAEKAEEADKKDGESSKGVE